ncbi:IS3 family transposase [Chitinophaga sp. 30R24]|uniref:IS3 family transposase n=1 Tax=Chitinophaga sp. 30R24 TaxID=3248838 RepID=UPI003B90E635
MSSRSLNQTGHHTVYGSINVAKKEMFEFIEIWYNRQRIHSILGYLPPEEFSKSILNKAA